MNNQVVVFDNLMDGTVVDTQAVIKELDRVSDILFNSGINDSSKQFRFKADVWFEICKIRNDIWFVNNDQHTVEKLKELKAILLKFSTQVQ